MKMNTKLKFFLISCFLILSSSLFGQHWTATTGDHNDYMTVYLNVSIDGVEVQKENLELAAFCNGICRGVGGYGSMTVGPYNYYYYRVLVRANQADINTTDVTFKVYDPETDKEYISDYTVKYYEPLSTIGSQRDPQPANFVEDNSSNEWYWDDEIPSAGVDAMTIHASILIDNIVQNDENTTPRLQLAVFSGSELRGRTSPVVNPFIANSYVTSVAFAGTDGETISFKLYNPADEIVYETEYTVTFQSEVVVGLPMSPQPINFITPYFAAQINETRYASLKDAIAAAVNNDLIKVINNISQTEAVEFPAGMNLTLDLNRFDVEVSGEGSITVSGNLTLVDNAGGASFTTTESNFIINEDAQLYHTLAGINATAVKSIEQTTDGWDGIASPMTAGSILDIETNGINELYYYDETGLEQNGLEWVAMAETSDNSYTLNEAGRGYLYANSVDPNQPQYESSFFFDFEDGTLNGWTTIDADDDGYCWYNDGGILYSDSYSGTEDYIVTSDKYTLNEDFVLSYDWVLDAGGRNKHEYIGIYLSIDNVNYGLIYEEYFSAPNNTNTSNSGTTTLDKQSVIDFADGDYVYFADITAYIGENVYFAFLHKDSNGNYASLDNIRLTSGAKSARADEGAILNFAGVLNHEDVSYDLTYTDSQLLKGFHLLGNPFAHNINVMNVWNETLANGYYAISNRGEWLARSTDNVAEVIAPMEAFLIKAGEAGKLTIRKSAGAKRSSSNGSLMISVTNGELRDDAYVSFNAGIGLDKISHRNENAPMLYIPAQDKNYAVAVMDKEVKEIPLSFEAKQMGQYTISAEALNCEFEELYLIDKQTGTTTNLNLEDYTFIARTGDDEERFVITKSLSGTNPESHDESFIYIDNGDLVVKNIEGEGHVRVFDVLGRPVAEFMAVESARISTERFGNGIYVIQMSDENGVKVQKILID